MGRRRKAKTKSRKEFSNLEFYLWRIRYLPSKKWREEILLMGSDEALTIIIESLRNMLDTFETYGRGTRKFRCNPPSDVDLPKYVQGQRAKIQWLNWLIVKLSASALEDAPYLMTEKTITVHYNPRTVTEFIEAARAQISSESQYGHGRYAPGGLWFSPDWLGIE